MRGTTIADLLAVVLSACTARDAVHIQVTYAAEPASIPLQTLLVFAGASKSSWSLLQPGESVSVVLQPQGEPPQVTMTYAVGALPREWRGPAIPAGVGYRIEITVTADGSVAERHCQMPCSPN